jgi:hypothetical protein
MKFSKRKLRIDLGVTNKMSRSTKNKRFRFGAEGEADFIIGLQGSLNSLTFVLAS